MRHQRPCRAGRPRCRGGGQHEITVGGRGASDNAAAAPATVGAGVRIVAAALSLRLRRRLNGGSETDWMLMVAVVVVMGPEGWGALLLLC